MEKTTVYLPAELKRSLQRVAAASGRSEAEVIREAIADRSGDRSSRGPRGQLFTSGQPSLAEQAEEALAGFGDRRRWWCRYRTDRLLTLDRRHFSVIRTAAGRSFTLLPEN